MSLMRNGITWDARHVLFRCKNINMEQKSVICSENACILIYANIDTVLKCSVLSCDFCFFSSLIWVELISQMHISLIIFNLNWYENLDRSRSQSQFIITLVIVLRIVLCICYFHITFMYNPSPYKGLLEVMTLPPAGWKFSTKTGLN